MYRIVTLERLEIMDAAEWSRIANPLQGLPSGHHPDVVLPQDLFYKVLESILVIRLFCKPSGVEKQRERRSTRCPHCIISVPYYYLILLFVCNNITYWCNNGAQS